MSFYSYNVEFLRTAQPRFSHLQSTRRNLPYDIFVRRCKRSTFELKEDVSENKKTMYLTTLNGNRLS